MAAKATRPTRCRPGIAALTAHHLTSTQVDEHLTALRALTEHRDDLVRTRTQTVNRLHALLAQLVPAGLPRGLSAEAAAAALRTVRPRAALARTLRQLASELLTELRRIDRRITTATETLTAALAACGSTQLTRARAALTGQVSQRHTRPQAQRLP
jgi:transposase